MENSKKIKAWIIAGYVLMVPLVIGVVSVTLLSLNHIHSIADELFNHPFRVNSAALKIKAEIVEIRDDMLEIALSNDPGYIAELANKTLLLDAHVQENMEVIETSFLGDMNQVRETKILIQNWADLRGNILAFASRRERGMVTFLVTTSGSQIFKNLDRQIDYIVDFSQKKAEFFINESRQEVADKVNLIWWLLVTVVVVMGIIISRIVYRVSQMLLRGDELTKDLEESHLINLEGAVLRQTILRELQESQDRIRDILEFAPIGMSIAEPDGKMMLVNQALCSFLGYSKEQLEQLNIKDITHPEDRALTEGYLRNLLKGNQRNYSIEKRYLTKNNQVIWGSLTISLHRDSSDNVFFISQIENITEKKKTEEKIQLMAKVFQNSGEAMMITDSEYRIIDINHSFTRLTGYCKEDIIGKNASMLSLQAESAELSQKIWQTLIIDGNWQGEIFDRRKDGSTYPKWLSVSTVCDANNKIINYVASFTDITERKRTENEIRKLAFHDTLTGLNNRYSLITQMEQILLQSKRDHTKFALMFIDLDRFKVINDTLGHKIGDYLLIQVADCMKASIRESDLVARLGGDEFVVVLVDLPHDENAAVTAQKIVTSISRSYCIEGHNFYTSPSIGISIYPDDGDDVNTLMKCADTAMYHAKSEGGNNFKFFDVDMNRNTEERLKFENDLHRALENEEFKLYFQPQISRNGEIPGVEALIRWHHPELGILLPEKFLDIAVQTGLILQIGRWSLESACRQLIDWKAYDINLEHITINQSSREFFQANYDEIVRNIIDGAGLRRNQIELEITESTAMANPEKVIEIMRSLKSIGIRLSMDDFGKGNFPLSYLGRFPIDQLKIDRSLILLLEEDESMLTITLATIELAKKLGIQVIAEGVENKYQSEILSSHGCDFQQGHFFCKPLPAEDFLDYLTKYHSLQKNA